MIVVDNITVVICVVLVLLAAMSVISDTFFRKIKEEKPTAERNEPVSVVIIADDNACELERNLNIFLSQDYPAGYEVIVVISKDEDGTKDVLKTFQSYKNLYVTFVPDTSRYMSVRKLAITLGVKAAKNELILLTDADCVPNTEQWICRMASCCNNGIGLVIGRSGYDEQASDYQQFDRLYREYTFMYEANNDRAYAMAGKNLLFKKRLFMKGQGFLGNLKYLRGEYAFLVNKYAAESPATINLSSEGMLIEKAPSQKEWHNENIFYAETRKHLDRNMRHRLIFNMNMLFLYAALFVSISSVICSIIAARWLILFFSAFSLVCPFIFRITNAKRVFRLFDVKIPLWKVIPFELHLVWHNLRYQITYIFADKYDFISHKS